MQISCKMQLSLSGAMQSNIDLYFYWKYVNRGTSPRTWGERQEVEREIRQ